MHFRKGTLPDKGKTLGKFFFRFPRECHDHIGGYGTIREICFQKTDTFKAFNAFNTFNAFKTGRLSRISKLHAFNVAGLSTLAVILLLVGIVYLRITTRGEDAYE